MSSFSCSSITLAHGSQFDEAGKPLYLLGNAFIAFFELEAFRSALVRPRFIAKGSSWPGQGRENAMKESKLQLRFHEKTPEYVIEQARQNVMAQLDKLQLEPEEYGQLKFGIDCRGCCDSPCFGCIVYKHNH